MACGGGECWRGEEWRCGGALTIRWRVEVNLRRLEVEEATRLWLAFGLE